MRFLFPGFLFALFAVAIPVIIHLFNFRKFKKVYFSNVRFLKEIEQKTSSSRQIRDWLLLAARVLAIVFLVFAFARPYIPSGTDAAGHRDQAISIYIDNSYSLETVNREGTLLDEAKRRAKEIAAAHGMNDRFQLLTNDFEGRHQRLLSYEDFVAAVDEVKISASSRSMSQVLNRQQDIVSAENAGKTIYMVSDFQKNMVDPGSLEVDTGINLRLVRLTANPSPNISVDSVWFLSPVHRPGETEQLVVQLRNNSDKKAESVPLKLTINGQQKAIASLPVEARGSSRDTLSFSGLQGGWRRGEVTITDYPIVFDDRFHFTFFVERRLQVLAINEQAVNPYLQAVYSADPFFNLVNTNLASINYSSLASYPTVILNGSGQISEGLAQQLKGYVQQGGTLMVFPSLTEDLSGLRTLSQALGTDSPQGIVAQETRVSSINLRHPLFAGVFEQLPKNMDLPRAGRYIQYARSGAAKQPILELPGRRTFLSQFRLGKGSVYLSAVPLDEEASNLVRHSVFVPLMYQSAFLSLRDNRLFYIVGKDQFLEAGNIALSPNQSLRLRNKEFEAIPDVRPGGGGTRLFIADQVRRQGNYDLLKGDSLLAVYAFNDNRSESDLSYASEDELKEKFPKQKVDVFQPGRESIDTAIKAVNYGMQLWKLCLILALIFLAAEIFIITFIKNGKVSI
ncbi:BatA domain-containing protein [Pedobacter sp. SYSU D00535]|uniref:BatA domain-containing protein n=1 Tax=Pedobacter sp. SYSU D00535 TaxID=2810308 RepID=UPI001A958B8A|nr:BatA domain-containing protein [Pedobacter sp. SYSU D00535]